MNDKILDNLKNRNDAESGELGQAAPERIAGKEREKTAEESAAEKKFAGEKQTHKAVPAKIRKNIPAIPQVQDEVAVKIEKILEAGLGDEFAKLSPIAKQEFKIKGEATSAKIRDLLLSTHIKVKKIFSLIIDWLRILPGINKFFLEQEAKIKTDQIIELHKKQKEKESTKLF